VDLLLIAVALLALAAASVAYGADSRDGLGGDEAARWDNWRWAAAERRGRLANALSTSQLEFDVHTRSAEALAMAASMRLTQRPRRPRRNVLRPALAFVAAHLGDLLVAAGHRLQSLAAPRQPAGGPV
jgi:hypothetical protein